MCEGWGTGKAAGGVVALDSAISVLHGVYGAPGASTAEMQCQACSGAGVSILEIARAVHRVDLQQTKDAKLSPQATITITSHASCFDISSPPFPRFFGKKDSSLTPFSTTISQPRLSP